MSHSHSNAKNPNFPVIVDSKNEIGTIYALTTKGRATNSQRKPVFVVKCVLVFGPETPWLAPAEFNRGITTSLSDCAADASQLSYVWNLSKYVAVMVY